MLLMLLIGWTILLPAIVVGGLYLSSSVLGRRRSALHAYEDLLVDEETLDAPSDNALPETQPRETARPIAPVVTAPAATAPAAAAAPASTAAPDPTAPARRPVGARY